MKKLTIQDVDLRGKHLLMRVDYNVPLDENQEITDDKRIRATLPTIQYAVEQGARVILMSHLGRPKGNVIPEMSLKPAAVRLGELLNQGVKFAPDCIGADVEAMVGRMADGDVMLLENVRFHKAETNNDPEFSEQLAKLGDVYANDAFGSAHRAHSSTVGVTAYFDTCVAGYLMKKELDYLDSALANPESPFVAILGGAKVADKIPVIENLIDKVDRFVIGGGMMFTFLQAQGKEIGDSLLDETSLDFARRIVNEKPDIFVLPVDCVVSDAFNLKEKVLGETRVVSVDYIPAGWIGLDIGERTINAFGKACQGAKTIVWNGPMGVFEMSETAKGTLAMASLLAELTDGGATTVIGGGDSASAVKKAGVADRMSHVSTGGGASLEFLQGKQLPGVAALTDA